MDVSFSESPKDVTEYEKPSKNSGANQKWQMRSDERDEEQKAPDNSREQIDRVVALGEIAEKPRDRYVAGRQCVGFVDQGRERNRSDYPDYDSR